MRLDSNPAGSFLLHPQITCNLLRTLERDELLSANMRVSASIVSPVDFVEDEDLHGEKPR